ncbi:hypothetical protein GGP41_010586 [Bipolaris sorokiniana]|uniref:Uncharacterized protein n=1 Tax=Cochliobolus sativus TaxID=45130 RepID=A0A8H5ZNE7_COCSA|nr:hypothetical protein GGP41_010586 [Bipolaris sorokiniana]
MRRYWFNAFAAKSRYAAKADISPSLIWISMRMGHCSELQNLSVALTRLPLAIPPVYNIVY